MTLSRGDCGNETKEPLAICEQLNDALNLRPIA
jgi:hypothetical protein